MGLRAKAPDTIEDPNRQSKFFFFHSGLAVHEQRRGGLSQRHPDHPQADGGRPLPHSRTMGPPGLSLRPSLGKRDLL